MQNSAEAGRCQPFQLAASPNPGQRRAYRSRPQGVRCPSGRWRRRRRRIPGVVAAETYGMAGMEPGLSWTFLSLSFASCILYDGPKHVLFPLYFHCLSIYSSIDITKVIK